MPITLSPETEKRWIQAAEQQGVDPEELLIPWLDGQKQFDPANPSAQDDDHEKWWANLSEDEQQLEKESLRASIEAGDAGRVRPAAEVYARVRASVEGVSKIKETKRA